MRRRKYRHLKRRVVAPLLDALLVLAGLVVLFGIAALAVQLKARPARADVEISFAETPVPVNMLTEMTIRIVDGKARELVPTAGHQVHVFITSDDLILYGHDHPDSYTAMQGNNAETGTFSMPILFPRPGHYALAVTYGLSDATTVTRIVEVGVADKSGAVPGRKQSPPKDSRTSKQFSDYLVTLRTDPATLIACKPARLEYEITQNGNSVISQLEPLDNAALAIGAWDEALTSFLFSPARAQPTPAEGEPSSRTAVADILFEAPGGYQIFSEFQRNGDIVPASFFVNVSEGPC